MRTDCTPRTPRAADRAAAGLAAELLARWAIVGPDPWDDPHVATFADQLTGRSPVRLTRQVVAEHAARLTGRPVSVTLVDAAYERLRQAGRDLSAWLTAADVDAHLALVYTLRAEAAGTSAPRDGLR